MNTISAIMPNADLGFLVVIYSLGDRANIMNYIRPVPHDAADRAVYAVLPELRGNSA